VPTLDGDVACESTPFVDNDRDKEAGCREALALCQPIELAGREAYARRSPVLGDDDRLRVTSEPTNYSRPMGLELTAREDALAGPDWLPVALFETVIATKQTRIQTTVGISTLNKKCSTRMDTEFAG
jgi:hypothetical protein